MTKTRKLGDAEVFPIGLGGMPMSLSSRPPEEQSVRTIQAAIDAGVDFIDTADAYSADDKDFGHNERLIAKALDGRRDSVIIATKGGHTRTAGGGWELDGRPEYLKAACERSLKALGTDRIDLYQYHRPDPEVPYAESIGALKELQDEGKIRWIGISNADRRADRADARDRRARRGAEPALARVHRRRSPRARSSCASGTGSRSCRGRRSAASRRRPRRRAAHDPVRAAADAHGVSPQQVALAWLLALSPVVIPIPGASRPESISDSARAVDLELSHDELQAIGGIAQTA